MTTSSISISISDFQVEDHQYPDRVALWRDDPESVRSGGTVAENMGKLLISLNVDGMWDIVEADLMQTDPLTAMNEAIAALVRLRDAVAELPIKRGRCTKHGGTGRCNNLVGQPCDFPTDEEMYAEVNHHVEFASRAVAS